MTTTSSPTPSQRRRCRDTHGVRHSIQPATMGTPATTTPAGCSRPAGQLGHSRAPSGRTQRSGESLPQVLPEDGRNVHDARRARVVPGNTEPRRVNRSRDPMAGSFMAVSVQALVWAGHVCRSRWTPGTRQSCLGWQLAPRSSPSVTRSRVCWSRAAVCQDDESPTLASFRARHSRDNARMHTILPICASSGSAGDVCPRRGVEAYVRWRR